MGRKIRLKSMVNGTVNLLVPELRLNIVWNKKNTKKPVDLDTLKEAVYYEGVSSMFTDGILTVDETDSLAILIDLGFEEPGVKEPQNIIVLNDAQRKRLLTTAPDFELEDLLKKLSFEQINELVDFAIENELTDYNKIQMLKEAVGIDIISAINLKKQGEEKITEE